MSMLPPGELWCDAGRRIRTGRAWRDQCVAARSLTDPLFSVPDGFRVILNGFTVDGVARSVQSTNPFIPHFISIHLCFYLMFYYLLFIF